MYLIDRSVKEGIRSRSLQKQHLEELHGQGQPNQKPYYFQAGVPLQVEDKEGYKLLDLFPSLIRVTKAGKPVGTYDFSQIKYNQKKQIAKRLGYEWADMLVTEPELEGMLVEKFEAGADPIILEEFRNGSRNN